MRGALIALFVAAVLTACGGDDQQATTPGDCTSVEQPGPREPESLEPPADELDASKTYTLALETNCGTFIVELNTSVAPNAAGSLVALARAGYFDQTVFHRIAPGFVIQDGDPTQSGQGGPGFSTVDAPPPDAAYTVGTVAMAKAASEPAGTAGSQFFVVTAQDVGLPPEYAVVGDVAQGLDVVQRIGLLGDANEEPTQPVVIHTVTVAET